VTGTTPEPSVQEEPMISRIVDCNVRNDKLHEFRHMLNEQFVPQIKQQPGFVDLIEALDADSGRFVCNSFWKTRADLEKYDSGFFQQVAGSLRDFMTTDPKVSTLEVENSTVHHIAEGHAAAA
jgi:quinol monooxygenase YgiN